LGTGDNPVENSRPEFVPVTDFSSIEAELVRVASAYRIEIVTDTLTIAVATQHGKIEGKRPTSEAIEGYAALFLREFTLYPTALVKRSRLRRIVLCEGLSLAGERRAGVPDFEHDVLYLDIPTGDYDEMYQCETIHHEFFHVIDFQDDGQVYVDERWSRLNRPDFKYASGGRSAQNLPSFLMLTDRFPGFLNQYSTTGVEEDKAEVFANMIVEPAYVDMRVQTDPVLKAKVARMRELLAAFCPEVNDAFWAKVAIRDAISSVGT